MQQKRYDSKTRDILLETHQRIHPYIHRTPVMTSRMINDYAEANIYFKCENFQRMGAFKMRGGANAVLSLSDEERAKGVVTHSSGNFAQGVALSAKSIGAKAYIVMPSSAPLVKQNAVKGYGGQVTISEATLAAREAATQKIIEETGASFLHPSNDMAVILGNATSAMELLEEQEDLDVILTPVGGGGLLAGTALAVQHFGKDCLTIGGEPLNADDAYRSLISGNIETNTTADTVADGLRTHLGDINFPIIQKYVNRIIRVEEETIIEAMRLIWERMKIIVEPSSAVPLAALLSDKSSFKNLKVGIIISGGNVDLSKLPFCS